MPTPDQMLTSAEAAQVAQVHLRTIRHWVKRGWLEPAYRGRGRTGVQFFRVEDVRGAAARRAAAGRGESSAGASCEGEVPVDGSPGPA